jgi:hypothetical protein
MRPLTTIDNGTEANLGNFKICETMCSLQKIADHPLASRGQVEKNGMNTASQGQVEKKG